jgi:hypothetical protein
VAVDEKRSFATNIHRRDSGLLANQRDKNIVKESAQGARRKPAGPSVLSKESQDSSSKQKHIAQQRHLLVSSVERQRAVVLGKLEVSTDPSERVVLAQQAAALGRVIENFRHNDQLIAEHVNLPEVSKAKNMDVAKQKGGIVGGRINQEKVAVQKFKPPIQESKPSAKRLSAVEQVKLKLEERLYQENLLQIQKPWPSCVDTPIETQDLFLPQDLKVIQPAYYDPDYSSVANTSALSLMSRMLIKSAINHTYCRHGLTRIVDKSYRCDH